jgi:hypothetical protein
MDPVQLTSCDKEQITVEMKLKILWEGEMTMKETIQIANVLVRGSV